MKAISGILLIVVAVLAGLAPPAGAKSLTPFAALEMYLDSANVVAAVEIVSIDDSAAAADGPRILTAKVLAVAKGDVSVGQTLRIAEATQMAATYHPGERRLLLLDRQTPREPFHRKAEWWNIPPGLELLVEETALDKVESDALRQWVRGLIVAERAAPAVEIRIHDRSDSTLELLITLINRGTDVIQLDPSRVVATFDAVGRHYIPQIKWNALGADAWIDLKPGDRLSGSMSVEQILPALRRDPSSLVKFPDGTTGLPVMVGHMCLRFPLTRAWVGYTAIQVPLQP